MSEDSKKIWKVFIAGGLCAVGIISLWQDLMGKETYIAFIREHWTSGYISVPIAIAMFMTAITALAKALTPSSSVCPEVTITISREGQHRTVHVTEEEFREHLRKASTEEECGEPTACQSFFPEAGARD